MVLTALPPPIGAGQMGLLQFDVLTPLIVVAGALYLWGVKRVNGLQPRHPWSGWRTASFLGGLVVMLLAVDSFIGVYDQTLFWVHMVQHLMLIMITAPLLAVGCPVLLLWRATTGEAHQRVTRALRSRPAELLDHPLVAFVLYALVIPITHLTVLYDWTIDSGAFNDVEHLLFVVVGYLFWRQVVAREPSSHRLHPGMRLAYLAFAVPVDSFTGLTLTEESREIFPAFVAQHRTWGPSLVTDLHLGGVVMWVGGDSLMFVAMIPVALAWLHYEERRALRVDRELDAMFPDRYPQAGGAAQASGAI